MKPVNLLPGGETLTRHKARSIDPIVVGGVAFVLAVAVAVGGGFMLERSHLHSEQQQLAAARAELARAQAQQPPPGTTPKVLSAPAALALAPSWRQAIEGVLATRVPWDHTLGQLSRVVPAGVRLADLSLSGAAAGGPGSLAISGKASTKLDIVQLLSRLTLVPELAQVDLSSTNVDPATGEVSFSVQAQVAAPAPASAPAAATASTPTGSSS